MWDLLGWYIHIPAWTDENRHLCCIPRFSWTTLVSLSDLCWAVRGSHASHHLPESENRTRCFGQKCYHRFCLARVFANFCFFIFVQRQFTLTTLFAAVCLWLNHYILLHALCPPCPCSPWARGSVSKQKEGRPNEEKGICHHCCYSRSYVCDIYRDSDLHCITCFISVGIQ